MNRVMSVAATLLSLMISSPGAAAPAAPALPTPAWVSPTPVTRTLANGLRVVVFPDHRIGVVQAQLRVPAGTREEPDNRPGVAALTGQMLRGGTSSRSPQQYMEHLENLGAVYGVSVMRDIALMSLGFRSADLDAGLELMADAVISPIFDEAAFEQTRRQVASQLGQQMQNLGSIADERIQESAFRGHPYGRPALGSLDALLQTTTRDLQSFHRERWRPDRAVLALTGDVTAEQAFRAAEQWFSHWGGRASADRAATLNIKPTIRVVDVAEAPFTEVRVAVAGPGRRSAEFPAWSLASARLEESGLPAGARASLTSHLDASLLVLAQPARTDSAANVAKRLREVLARASRETPSTWEARRKRESQAEALSLESLGARLTQWLVDDAAGSASDASSSKLRPDDPAVFQRAFGGPVAVLAAGPAELLSASFARFGAYDVQALARALTEAPVDTLPAPTAEELKLGRAATTAAIAAHGGIKALRAIRTQLADGEITLDAGGREVTGQFSSVRAPERFIYMTKLFSLETRQVLDRGVGWALSVADSAELTELDSTAVNQLSASRESDLVHVLIAASGPTSRPALRGTDVIDGKTVELVDLLTSRGPLRLAIDAKTHRVSAIDGVLSRQAWLERRVLRDVRKVGDLYLPHDEERLIEGRSLSRILIRQLGLNAPVDEALFVRPMVRRGQIISP